VWGPCRRFVVDGAGLRQPCRMPTSRLASWRSAACGYGHQANGRAAVTGIGHRRSLPRHRLPQHRLLRRRLGRRRRPRQGRPVTPVAATTTDAVAPLPAAVVGARCPDHGATGVTADGATAYCAHLQDTDRDVWSLHQGEIPNPSRAPSRSCRRRATTSRRCLSAYSRPVTLCSNALNEILRGNGLGS